MPGELAAVSASDQTTNRWLIRSLITIATFLAMAIGIGDA
jgi:hypothetical protein